MNMIGFPRGFPMFLLMIPKFSLQPHMAYYENLGIITRNMGNPLGNLIMFMGEHKEIKGKLETYMTSKVFAY
jgi:hypothetical protein